MWINRFAVRNLDPAYSFCSGRTFDPQWPSYLRSPLRRLNMQNYPTGTLLKFCLQRSKSELPWGYVVLRKRW